MEEDSPQPPAAAGLYWASSKRRMPHYDMILRVDGEPPYLRISDGWHVFGRLSGGTASGPMAVYDIAKWGPEVSHPDASQ